MKPKLSKGQNIAVGFLLAIGTGVIIGSVCFWFHYHQFNFALVTSAAILLVVIGGVILWVSTAPFRGRNKA